MDGIVDERASRAKVIELEVVVRLGRGLFAATLRRISVLSTDKAQLAAVRLLRSPS